MMRSQDKNMYMNLLERCLNNPVTEQALGFDDVLSEIEDGKEMFSDRMRWMLERYPVSPEEAFYAGLVSTYYIIKYELEVGQEEEL